MADLPHPRRRLAVAFGVAVAAGCIAAVKAHRDLHGFQTDFGLFWSAAKVLVEGGNPYRSMLFMYPLPSAMALAPLSWLPMSWAAIMFVALSMGLCAFALTRDSWHRLPILMSFPALVAMSAGQWAPLVVCAALGSGYGWTAALKPTLGLAMLARRIDWRGALLAGLVGLVSLAINPHWPWEWLSAVRQLSTAKIHHVPFLLPGGFLLLPAILRWRTADGRMLFVMGCIPQSMFFYDQLALGLLARTRMQAIVASLWSYVVTALAYLLAPANIDTLAQNASYFSKVIMLGYYLPAMIVVLRRSSDANASESPSYITRRPASLATPRPVEAD